MSHWETRDEHSPSVLQMGAEFYALPVDTRLTLVGTLQQAYVFASTHHARNVRGGDERLREALVVPVRQNADGQRELVE